jgi:hypothetical protein
MNTAPQPIVEVIEDLDFSPKEGTQVSIEHHAFGGDGSEVFAFTLRDCEAEAEEICELCFRIGNGYALGMSPAGMGLKAEDEEVLSEQYYSNRIRSLSVGDRVRVDARAFECSAYGWKEVYEHQ